MEGNLASEVAKRLKQAESRVQTAERKVALMDHEAQKLRATISELEHSYQTAVHGKGAAESRVREFSVKLHEEIETKRREVDAAKKEYVALQLQVDKMKKDKTENKSRQAQETSSIEAQLRVEEEKSKMLAEKTQQLQLELDKEKRVSSQKLNDSYDAMDAESRRNKELSNVLDNLRQENKILSKDFQLTVERKSELESVFEAARNAEFEAKEKVSKLEHQVRTLRQENDEQDLETKGLKSRIAFVEQQLSEACHERDAIKLNVNESKMEMESLQNTCDNLNAGRLEYVSKIENLKQEISQLQSEKHMSMDRTAEARTHSVHEIRSLEIENEKLRQEIHILKESLHNAQRANESTENSTRMARREIESMNQLLRQNRSTILAYESDLQEKHALQGHVARLENEVESLRQSNRSALHRMQLLKGEFDTKQLQVKELIQVSKDLEVRLGASEDENQHLTRRHELSMKVKDAEAAYIWKKLDQALQM